MLQRILFLGALFQWRIAVGLFCIPPIICIFILATIAPESPSWLMSKGKDAEALKGTYNGLALIMYYSYVHMKLLLGLFMKGNGYFSKWCDVV